MIRVCTPYYSDFNTAKVGLKSLAKDSRFELIQARGSIISNLRNSFITKNVGSSLKKQEIVDRDFLFIDSDIGFSKNHIDRVLELSDLYPIIFLPYITQANHELYQCGTWGKWIGSISGRYPIDTKGIKQVDWCGAGFLFIKKEVFYKIDYPYFRFELLEIGANATQMGEDIAFCKQVHNKFPIYCDFDNPVNHNLRS